jgi:hypothetical protein
VFSWNGINVIKKLHICPFRWHRCNFLIKKLNLCNSRRTPEDALAFLIYIHVKDFFPDHNLARVAEAKFDLFRVTKRILKLTCKRVRKRIY